MSPRALLFSAMAFSLCCEAAFEYIPNIVALFVLASWGYRRYLKCTG